MKLARRAAPLLAPLAVLAAALVLAHGEIFRADAAQQVALGLADDPRKPSEIADQDVRYEAWLTARHARTLLSRPWRLFETEHCAPDRRTLTYGVPMVAMGILAMPAALFSDEPVLVYNSALVAWSAVAALAMYSLVAGWTGRRAAGVGAALLFAFHPIRLGNVLHPAEWDIAWTAFALHFAERLFSQGRWRDALGLGLAGAMQVATSFYTLFAASLLALPLGLWLLLRRAPRRVTPAQLAVALGCVALATALVLGPYLSARHADRIGGRMLFFFARWSDQAPGGRLFLGFPILLFALVGLCVPRRLGLARVDGDPRAALCAAALLVAVVAAGPTTAATLQRHGFPVPNFDPYRLLAAVIPGLDAVRVVARFTTAVHLVACVLAGAGIAAAITSAGRHGRAAAAGLVALCFLASVGSGPTRYVLEAIRPEQESIEFFAALAAQGNAGPLLELPLDLVGPSYYAAPARILLSAWHGRRTSACFGSYRQRQRMRLQELADRLPDREAARALREQGFTTVLVQDTGGIVAPMHLLFERAAAEPEPALRLLHRIDSMSAYALLPETARPTP